MHNKIRIDSLDYLRGLMAIMVMIYHYVSWSGLELGADSFLSKMGVYAVSIFFILSGLSLRHVYQDKIEDRYDVASFVIRRLFRIAPLFWLSVCSVIFLQIAIALTKGESIDINFYQLFLNVTFLFSFIQPDAYMSTGAWSIGNEIVYYSLVPILFFFMAKYRARSDAIAIICLVLSVIVAIVFAFSLLDKNSLLETQWATYINPLNNLFLFVAGVVIGRGLLQQRYLVSILAAGSFFVFVILPAGDDRISIVTEYNRLTLAFCCVLFVWAVYSFQFSVSGILGRFMSFLGQGCYSIYLMHPLVAIPVVRIGEMANLSLGGSYCMAGIVTLMTSWFTFKFIEKPMIDYGKKVAARFNAPDRQAQAIAASN